jgi:ribosomal protein S18 acetylase RimI-like enzyme
MKAPAEIDERAHLNFVDFCRQSARWSGDRGRVHEREGVMLYATGTEFPAVCNGVFRVDDRLTGTETIDLAEQWFAERRRGYTAWVREIDDIDADIAAAAEAAGLLPVLDEPEMICRRPIGAPELGDGVELRWMTTAAEVELFTSVNGRAYAVYGMPEQTIAEIVREPSALLGHPTHTVLAFLHGEPVGSAQLVMSDGFAGVYWVATIESARQMGLGEAVTRAVTDRAFRLGASAVGLQASPMGEPIYRRMGYETSYRYTGWVRFAAPD